MPGSPALGLVWFPGWEAPAGPASTGRGFTSACCGALAPCGGPTWRRVKMARIAGVNIPTNKRVVIALQYIHGIGSKKASDICQEVGIPGERRVAELSDAEVVQIRETIDRSHLV